MATAYVLTQLEQALRTAIEHPDADVRARARTKAQRWQAVIEGMAAGTLTIGSRTPVPNTPAWVTLEVAHGGFATGRYLAEGELLEHEQQLLATLPAEVPGDTPRERINHWYLSDAGQAQLRAVIDASRYRVELPEEGALPVIAALLDRGHSVAALELLEHLRPLMHRLRFYPRLEPRPRPAGACVRRSTIAEIATRLEQRQPNTDVATMNEALSVWAPLFDGLVMLWLDTVDGEWPWLEPDPDGKPCITGGWPCKRFPADWPERRTAWLAAYEHAWAQHRCSTKHRQRKSNFARLRSALERCPHDSSALDSRDVGWIRRTLANTLTRHGAPGSERRDRLRRVQTELATRPLHADVARVLALRMLAHGSDGGLPSLDGLDVPVRKGESKSVRARTPIPTYLLAKAERALEAPIAELIERGVIGSSEVLAQVLPQMTAQVIAAGIDDVGLRELFGQIYAAFRRRRSLLLVNLDSQVRFDELPWVAALAPFRRPPHEDPRTSAGLAHAAAAGQTLDDVVIMALSAFPHTLTPNPLVRELRTLAQQAGLASWLPLVEEIAADIFTGVFTDKWAQAAQRAAVVLDGTLYARYYDLPLPGDHRLRGFAQRWGQRVAEGFTKLCRQRAAEAGQDSGRNYVAARGTIIEQSQILTTHNLAVLIDGLHLRERMRPLAPSLAAQVFAWIVARQLPPADNWRARLQLVKNVAYAWRQAIFLLSLCERDDQAAVLDEFGESLERASTEWTIRLQPAHAGLRMVFEGGRFGADGRDRDGGNGRRLLGWSAGPHWLLA